MGDFFFLRENFNTQSVACLNFTVIGLQMTVQKQLTYKIVCTHQ